MNPSSQIRFTSLSQFNQCRKLSLPSVRRSSTLKEMKILSFTLPHVIPNASKTHKRSYLAESMWFTVDFRFEMTWGDDLHCEVHWTIVCFCVSLCPLLLTSDQFLCQRFGLLKRLDGAWVGGPGLSEAGVSVMMCCVPQLLRTQPHIVNAPWNQSGVWRHGPEMERTSHNGLPNAVFFHML